MKRPDKEIGKVLHSTESYPQRYQEVIAKYIAHLESQLQPRKTVSDAVDYFDGVWPDDNDTNVKFLIPHKEFIFDSIPVQDESRCYQVCTRKEFEAEVDRRSEEWTHIDAFGDPCRIIADKPDSHGNVVILRQEGWYASVAASSVKLIKPTISKAEAWSKLMIEHENPKGKPVLSAFYDILDNFEVK